MPSENANENAQSATTPGKAARLTVNTEQILKWMGLRGHAVRNVQVANQPDEDGNYEITLIVQGHAMPDSDDVDNPGSAQWNRRYRSGSYTEVI